MDNVPPPLPPTGPYPGYPYQPPRPPNWFSRNWPWFVPVGCLSLLVVFAAFGLGIALLVFNLMKSSEPYKTAMTRARANPQVAAALGAPIKEPFYLTGNMSEGSGSGSAKMLIPLSGPKGSGTLDVVATKSGGAWTYSTMRVRVKGGPRSIDLLDADR